MRPHSIAARLHLLTLTLLAPTFAAFMLKLNCVYWNYNYCNAAYSLLFQLPSAQHQFRELFSQEQQHRNNFTFNQNTQLCSAFIQFRFAIFMLHFKYIKFCNFICILSFVFALLKVEVFVFLFPIKAWLIA